MNRLVVITGTPSSPTGGRSSTASRIPPGSSRSRRPTDAWIASASRGSAAYAAAVASCVADCESLTVHLHFPADHWKRCRHTNFIERSFGETRRRTKAIGRLSGEHSCVALVFAMLDRYSRGWRGMTMTPRALRRLQDLRREFLESDGVSAAEDSTTAAA